MASSTSNFFVFVPFILAGFLLSLCLLFPLKEGHASEEIREGYLTHTIQVSSLLPSPVCNHSSKADERMSTFKVVDTYGPCFQANGDNKTAAVTPSLTDIDRQDRARLNSIHSSLSKLNSGRLRRDMLEISPAAAPVAQAPVSDGEPFRTSSFVVKVGLGTPVEEFSLVLDTGSDLTWTQCEPCDRCFNQAERIFNPILSSTYHQILRTNPVCAYVERPRNVPPDRESKCVYEMQYEDGSTSIGYFSNDILTFSNEKIDGFLFGCGYDQDGSFDLEAGILGLNQEQASLVSQTAAKYNKIFSYCFPSSASSTGHLTLGGPGSVANVKFTTLNTETKSLYGVDLVGINLGGRQLAIDASIFSGGAIVDSGSIMTYLPPSAFKTLRDEFRTEMATLGYQMVPDDTYTCYNFNGHSGTITVPVISFRFSDGTVVDIPEKSSLVLSRNEHCLAFSSNDEDDDVSIIGNQVQRTMEVVYDIPGGKIGFAPRGCT